jgi:hypothetical protein
MRNVAIWTLVFSLALVLSTVLVPMAAQAQDDNACWGQATKVFAATGEMGKHSSQQENPRIGLRNLARLLYDAGIIEEDTMAALGAFVAEEFGLSIDACQ